MARFATIALTLLTGSMACAQTASADLQTNILDLQGDSADQQDDSGGLRFQPFDACGIIEQGNGCILFEGGGGVYVLPDAPGFNFGDTVRVVGTLDPECTTICDDTDGCIRGAAVYDPTVFPCGTDLPNFPEDIITNTCSSIGAGLPALALIGLWFTRRRRS
jgi:hypothetical protein